MISENTRFSFHCYSDPEFWWNERKPDETTLWESKIRLGEDLFNEIIRHPVPIDMNILTALKGPAHETEKIVR